MSLSTIERLRAWSYDRQRIGDPESTVEQALRAVVAVYATHPTAPLALQVRARSFTAARYRSIDRDRKGIRVPAMRRTIFLVPRKDAARVFTATRASSTHALRPLKRIDLSTEDYEELAKKILTATKVPLSKRDLEEAAGIKGQELGTVLRCLRYEGRVVTLAGDSLHSSPHHFAATAAWVPEGIEEDDADGALAWLAGEYLRAYGPARVEDFAWWSGVAKRKAAAAVESHKTADLGDGLLLRKQDLPAFERFTRLSNATALLPKWDAYTMGHAPDGRARFVHPDVQERVYTPIGVGLPGDGNPVVLVDGQVVATWTFTIKDGANVQPFDTIGPKVRRVVDEKLNAVVALLTDP